MAKNLWGKSLIRWFHSFSYVYLEMRTQRKNLIIIINKGILLINDNEGNLGQNRNLSSSTIKQPWDISLLFSQTFWN